MFCSEVALEARFGTLRHTAMHPAESEITVADRLARC